MWHWQALAQVRQSEEKVKIGVCTTSVSQNTRQGVSILVGRTKQKKRKGKENVKNEANDDLRVVSFAIGIGLKKTM